MQQITPQELNNWLERPEGKPVLLDVREPWEYQTARIEGSLLVPMNSMPARLGEFDPEVETVVICHHGMRSMQVAGFLERNGFSKVFNLAGGVDAWARQVAPDMPVY